MVFSYVCFFGVHLEVNDVKYISELVASNRQVDAFKEIFYRYHGRLVLFANRFTGDLQVSQDLVQDAFLKLWEKSESLSSVESPRAYLFTAVRNSCFNHLRHINIKKMTDEQLAQKIDNLEKSLYFEPGDPLKSLLETEFAEKMEEIVRLMPEKCQLIYRMSRQEYKKNSQIAEELGISVKMVEKHISKGLLILRKGLSEYLGAVLLIFFQRI